jgi:dolichol kinase
MESTMEIPVKIIDLPYDRVIPFLGMYLKECESDYNRDTSIPMFIAVLFTASKLWKHPRFPTTHEWINKL